MQFEKGVSLREQWGDKICPHPDTEREYYLGSHTGDLICTQCGANFFSRQELEEEREKNKKLIE